MGVVLCNSYTHCLVITQDLRGFDEMGADEKAMSASPCILGKRLVAGLFLTQNLSPRFCLLQCDQPFFCHCRSRQIHYTQHRPRC